MTKQQLRASLLGLRSGIEPDEVARKSQAIVTRLMSEIEWSGFRQVHCYSAMPGEVQTSQLVGWLEDSGIKVTIPRLNASAPTDYELSQSYDLIVVPMLGFDLKLHRLGYGGGFYDRLLSELPQVPTVGLCFQLGLIGGALPSEPHDQVLDMIVTEDRAYRA